MENNLKQQIIDKYKSVRRFTRLSGEDVLDMRRILSDESAHAAEVERLKKVVRNTPDTGIPGLELTNKLRERIRIKIISHKSSKTESGKTTITQFARNNDFHPVWLSRVINPSNSRKMMKIDTPKMKRLLSILNIKL